MTRRTYLSEQIDHLKRDVVDMGTLVEATLNLAVRAFLSNNASQAEQVFDQDTVINLRRHDIEKKVVTVMATQQPMAVDLRTLIAMLAMSADLERMGDQAKNIAKAIPFMADVKRVPFVDDLKYMANLGTYMLRKSLIAYLNDDIDLAQRIAEKDDELDQLFAKVYTEMVGLIDQGKGTLDPQVGYEVLRIAQTLERFGDLATNLAERVIYKVTSNFTEINRDHA